MECAFHTHLLLTSSLIEMHEPTDAQSIMCLIRSQWTLLRRCIFFVCCGWLGLRFGGGWPVFGFLFELSRSVLHHVSSQLAKSCATMWVPVAPLTRCPFRRQIDACWCAALLRCRKPQSFSNRSQFDCTFGFPGEGPDDTWSLFSHNTGSLRTTMQWQSSMDSVICVQEPRIGRNNHRDASFRVQATGRQLFSSKLLPGLITNHGVSRTPHGGSAILAPQETTQAFDPLQDITGLYQELYNSTRVTAVWHQVTKHVRALIWSFYGRSGASSEQDPHSWNDHALSQIFEISAQYGDIPVLIAGDFQAEPSISLSGKTLSSRSTPKVYPAAI